MTVSIWMEKDKKKEIHVDIAIIGAGIAGVSVAYWLSYLNPSLKVAVIEKGFLGCEASGRNAGFFTAGSLNHFFRMKERLGEKEAIKIWKFSEENKNLLYDHIINENQKEIEFEREGSITLAREKDWFEKLSEMAALLQEEGIATKSLTKKELREKIGVEDFVGAFQLPTDGTLNPIKLLSKIRGNIEKRNSHCHFYERNSLFQIDCKESKQELHTPEYRVIASQTVIATNGFSETIDPYFRNKVIPLRGQVLLSERYERVLVGAVYEKEHRIYYRQLPTGEFLVGGAREEGEYRGERVDDRVSTKVASFLEKFCREYIPSLRTEKSFRSWSGVMGFTKNELPLLGELPEQKGLFYLVGFSGHGMGLAFHCAKAVAEKIVNDKALPDFLAKP